MENENIKQQNDNKKYKISDFVTKKYYQKATIETCKRSNYDNLERMEKDASIDLEKNEYIHY